MGLIEIYFSISDGSGTRYAAGGTYTANAAATLYAQWADHSISFVWDTTGQLSKSITVRPTAATTINWGDGVTENVTGSGAIQTLSHTYASAGNYTVKILDNVVIYLNCNSKKVTSLDVSGATALTDLRCYSNQLTSLDVSNNTALTSLTCNNNQLTSLDVSNNTALTTLKCSQSTMNVLVMDST